MSQEAQLDTMVVKRIQEACAASRAERAMDLASLIHLEKSFHIAMKVRSRRATERGQRCTMYHITCRDRERETPRRLMTDFLWDDII